MHYIITTRDFDWINVIVGPEGIGKSMLAIQESRESDPKFIENFPDNTVFDVGDLINQVANSYPGKKIIGDEGALMFFSRDAMTKDVKNGIKMLTAMRAYNLSLTICVPNFWIIDKYIREHRVKSVMRVVKRGWIHYYGPKKVRMIRQDKKKRYKTIWPDYDFRDSYPKVEPELWEIYKNKKKSIVSKSRDGIDSVAEKHNKKCLKCGYSWHYTGKTAPRCSVCHSSKIGDM